MSKKILIIGAGAVGQVYGYHLAQAGFDVSFFIKEKYREEMAQDVVLYNINKDKKRGHPIRFKQYGLVTSWEEASATSWSQIYLCISSAALHQGLNFTGLTKALGHGTLIMLQPGPKDIALVKQHVPEQQIVQGMITLCSYHTPMPGENTATPGTAYWLPPLVPTPFAGPAERRSDVIQTFIKGKLPARSLKSLTETSIYSTAFFMVFLTALEASGWKFEALRKNTALIEHLLQANQEAFDALAAQYKVSAPFWSTWVSPWMVKALLKAAPHALPFDLETFFQVHFTKVKEQTKLFMRTYIDDAKAVGVPAQRLEVLNSYT